MAQDTKVMMEKLEKMQKELADKSDELERKSERLDEAIAEAERKSAKMGELIDAASGGGTEGLKEAITHLSNNTSRQNLKDTNPQLLLLQETEKTITEYGEEMKDSSATATTESEFLENMGRWTKEGQIDSFSSACLFYLSEEATEKDRYAFKRALASGSWSRVMVTHSTIVLGHRKDKKSIVEDTMGHCLSGPIALLHEPKICPEIIKEVNRSIKAAQCNTVTGGGSGGTRSKIRVPADCTGFGPSVFQARKTGFEPAKVLGGGALPVLVNEDGSQVVDITAIENWCTRMADYFEEAFRPLVAEVEKLKLWAEKHKETAPQQDIEALQKSTAKAIKTLKTQVKKLTEEVSYRRFGRRPKSNYAWGGEVWDATSDLAEVESFWDPLTRGRLTC